MLSARVILRFSNPLVFADVGQLRVTHTRSISGKHNQFVIFYLKSLSNWGRGERLGEMRASRRLALESHLTLTERESTKHKLSGRIINFVCADRVLLNNLFSIDAGRERCSISRINYTFLSSTSANKQFLSAVCFGRALWRVASAEINDHRWERCGAIFILLLGSVKPT